MKVELLDNAAVTSKLSGYWRVKIVDEIPSTQSEIKNSNPSNWDLIAAEFQSAGRGRLDRSFESSKSDGLLFSFYVEPRRANSDWGFIPLIAGAVVANVLNKITSSNSYSCKWPNDILIDENKVAGLLAETHKSGVVVGIGINVTTSLENLPTPTATSVLISSQKQVDRNELLAQICNEFKSVFESWESGIDQIDYCKKISATLNRSVKAITPNGELSGRAVEISKSGALILESGAEITVGDLIHLRG